MQKPLKSSKMLARRNSLHFLSSSPSPHDSNDMTRQSVLKIKNTTASDHLQNLQREKNCFYTVDNLSMNVLLCPPSLPSLQLNCMVCLFFQWTGPLYDLKVLVYTALTCPLHPYTLIHRLERSSGYPIKDLSCILETEKQEGVLVGSISVYMQIKTLLVLRILVQTVAIRKRVRMQRKTQAQIQTQNTGSCLASENWKNARSENVVWKMSVG